MPPPSTLWTLETARLYTLCKNKVLTWNWRAVSTHGRDSDPEGGDRVAGSVALGGFAA